MMNRRHFVRTSSIGALGVTFMPNAGITDNEAPFADVVRVNNGEPEQLLHTAIEALGGFSRFISRNDIVVVKPNMGWDRAPEYAANTNPDLVAAIVRSCYEAGAREVKIFDRTCNNPLRCYRNSQIEERGAAAEAKVMQIRKNKYSTIKLKSGIELKEWAIYDDYLEADKIINVPVAKRHSLSLVSLGAKNLMGVMGDNRGSIHNGFATKLTDIVSEILPTLTIIDAYRILVSNGPSGGSLSDVRLQKSLIASPCMVSADIEALGYFSLKLHQVDHLKEMVNRGLNKFDIEKINKQVVDLV